MEFLELLVLTEKLLVLVALLEVDLRSDHGGEGSLTGPRTAEVGELRSS